MGTRTILLALHIAGAGAWLGANLVQLVVTPRLDRESAGVAAAWTRQQQLLGTRYYGPVGGLIAVTGVLLVLDGDWSWSSGFIWVGIAVVVIGAAMGVALFTPLADRRLAALEEGDRPAAAGALRTTLRLALLDSALVLLAVLAMVDKWEAS
jgi:type IV secretory pathway VirB2 component (pilin)